MKPGPLPPGEFAALRWIAVHIGRLSEDRVDAAELVIQEGKTYKFAADIYRVSAQAVWNTCDRMNSLLEVYRHAKELENAGAPTKSTKSSPKKTAHRSKRAE